MTLTKFTVYKLWLLFLGIALFLLFAKFSYAEESTSSSQTAGKLSITFPIAELGNCSSIENCKEYCSDTSHQEACTAFAKKKGFYKERNQGQGNAKMQELIQKAKEELGCSSEKECKEFCSQEENRDKCIAFAQKYGLKPLKSEVKNLIEKASKFLGCSGEDECKAFCQKQENRDKCEEFAKMAGLKRSDDGNKLENKKEASGEGKFTPNSQNAYEHANERARFCRENPDKCKNASGSGSLSRDSIEKKFEEDKKKLESKLEMEKKALERKGERLKNEVEDNFEERKRKMEQEMTSIDDKIENEIEDTEDENEDDSDVKGTSISPSLVDRVWHFFFK